MFGNCAIYFPKVISLVIAEAQRCLYLKHLGGSGMTDGRLQQVGLHVRVSPLKKKPTTST